MVERGAVDVVFQLNDPGWDSPAPGALERESLAVVA